MQLIRARPCALAIVAALLLIGPSNAQGVFDLGRQIDGYAAVAPDRTFAFPDDHGPHDGYRVEWWYLTANLEAEDGRRFGVQWTLFRIRMAPPGEADDAGAWRSPYVFMGHAGLTSGDAHFSAERFARADTGQADVAAAPAFEAFIDEWRFAADDASGDGLRTASVSAGGKDFSYALDLTATGPIVLQGEGGYSRKSPGPQASYYYSQPFFDADGEIVIDGEPVAVTGKAWMDREWSSQLLRETQSGWDWLSLHFDDGDKAMLFRLRDGTEGDYFAGTWIGADGTARPIAREEISFEPLARRRKGRARVPIAWRVQAGDRRERLRIEALNPDAFMATSFPYWEGPVTISGDRTGVGYLEMTGY